jgi:tetratricopeptide (TPR) repeat protein
MDIIDCYRLLELTSTASPEEVKMAYRRLARQLHPDVNADNQAQERFIRVTEAYKILVEIAAARPSRTTVPTPAPPAPKVSTPQVKVSVQKPVSPPVQPPVQTPVRTPTKTPGSSQQPAAQPNSAAGYPSPVEQSLKLETYRQLSDLIKRRSLPRAIATVEALQVRLPNDPEIRQWQALIYQRWGRQLIEERKLNQARAYLKKALKTDPHNKSLWIEIEQDFKRIENTL